MAKTQATKSNEVDQEQEQQKTTAVAVAARTAITAPAFMADEDFGAGFEGAGKDAYAIPFLQLLQKMSPLVDEDNAKHVPGAKAGMFYNTVTGKLYDVKTTPLELIQSSYRHSFIRWGSRDGDQGGFKGEVTPEEMDAIIARGEVENVDGKLLVKDAEGKVDVKKSDYYADTRAHYVIVIDPDTGESMAAILSLASTQIKSSKMLMTSLQNKKVTINGRTGTPATYANKIKLTTTVNTNEKGTWSVAKFELDGLVTDADLFNQAKEFHKAVATGAANADYSKSVETGEGSVSSQPQEAQGF
jgi:hypothetical protein